MTERKRIIRLVWINTGLVLGAALLIVAATWYFTNKRIQLLNDELASAKATEKTMASKKQELPNVAANLPLLLDESRVVALIFPNSPAQKELVDFLQQNVDKAGADVVEISMDEPADIPAKKKAAGSQTELEKALDKQTLDKAQFIRTTLSIRGGFENILSFMENLKRSNRFYRILKIKATPEANLKGTGETTSGFGTSLVFELEGEMFFTTEKLDIAGKFDELRKTLETVIAIQEPVEAAKPDNGLIEVKAGGTGATRTNKEEKPTK
jgi:hypothetical protein